MTKPLEISNAEYRAMSGLSSSDLKQMAKSPAHYKYFADNPQANDTPSLLFGRAYHKIILEPDSFYDEFAVVPYCDKRTKEGKAIWESFVKESEGKDVIDSNTMDTLTAMKDAFYATPYCRKLIAGNHEKSFFWEDEETGLKCKCRPDSYGKLGDENILVDLKTCKSAQTEKFMRDSINLNYDLQMAYYHDGLEKNTGNKYRVLFLAQEKTPPYVVNILECDDNYIRSGRDMYKTMLQTYKECTETGNWYGYLGADAEINTLGLPKWLENIYENEEGDE